ncbi:MAG: OmpA family protein [Gammaproteobacteria bacterium]|nr:OmpA family protein [Gammaproteobacteria bacterium]MBT8445306.1 OmpA family protein [Gammaproteobacteria bacterium]NND36611.1 OmpA family protein [Gammaproteobacteria bacterium]
MDSHGKLRRIAGITLISFLTVACTTLDPYTQEKKTSNAAKGAAIGAAAGAAVGLISGDDSAERKKRALILAGVGAIAGGGIGYYMDQQEMKLRQKLEGTGVSVTRMGDNITLNMPGNVTFAFNSGDISAQFYPILDSVALVLEEYDQTFVEVAGHTDSVGSTEYNQTLSERRAESVAAYLMSREVGGQRLITVGGGENYPIASNTTSEGQAQNRRVELTIVPVTS